LEGVHIDTIQESMPPATPYNYDDSLYQNKKAFAIEVSRVVRFKEAIDARMRADLNSTRVDSRLLFARCLLFDDDLDMKEPPSTESFRYDLGFTLEKWEEWYDSLANCVDSTISGGSTISTVIDHPYTLRTVFQLNKYSFIITRSGYIGIGPPDSKLGDVVSIFSGTDTPFVLRKFESGDSVKGASSIAGQTNEESWEIIGDCFLQSFMNNQVASPEWKEKRQMLRIV
jgi:hypothetical protein